MRVVAAAVVLVVLTACGGAQEASRDDNAISSLIVTVERPTLLTTGPLHDVGVGRLAPGQQVEALCYTRNHQTNAGVTGNAIKVKAGGREGYAPTSTLDPEPDDRRPRFDLSDAALADLLPDCGEDLTD